MTSKILLLMLSYGLLLTSSSHSVPSQGKELRLIKQFHVSGEIRDARNGESILTKSGLQFFDGAGNLQKEMTFSNPERTQVAFSKTGNVIGQTIAHAISEKGPATVDFNMFDNEGSLLWSAANISIGPLYLSGVDRGIAVERICYEGSCTNQIRILTDQDPNGRIVTPSVSPRAVSTGGDIAAAGKQFAITFDDEGSFNLVFADISGEEQWRYRLFGAWGGDVAVSPQGGFVAVIIREEASRAGHVYLFDKNGSVILKHVVDYVGDYGLKFSDDERQLAVGSTSGGVYCFDTTPPGLRWSYFFGDENLGVIDLDVFGYSVLAGVATIDRNDLSAGAPLPRYVYLFDSRGRPIFKRQFVNHGSADWRDGPRVQFARPGGDQIVIAHKNTITRYAR